MMCYHGCKKHVAEEEMPPRFLGSMKRARFGVPIDTHTGYAVLQKGCMSSISIKIHAELALIRIAFNFCLPPPTSTSTL